MIIHLSAADLPAADTGADGASRQASGEPRSAERVTGGRSRPYGRVAGGPGLPDAVVQRLTCAGRIRTAVHDRDGTVLDLGRSHRLVSDRLYRAPLLRDEGHCSHPGCGKPVVSVPRHPRRWCSAQCRRAAAKRAWRIRKAARGWASDAEILTAVRAEAVVASPNVLDDD